MNIQDYFDWEEYMCTGIDPTGGCLGPDFDPYTGKYLDEIEEEEEEEVEEVVVQRENLLAKAPYSTDPKDLHKMSKFARNGPQYLFFDTETTGLPYYDNISAEEAPDNWPRLRELHKYLFRKEFSDAHDAMADVKAVARCFWEMRDRRYI